MCCFGLIVHFQYGNSQLKTKFFMCYFYIHRILSNACNASANLNDPGTDQRRCVHVQCTVDFGCCCNWKSGGINRLQNIRNSIPIQRGGGEHRTLNTSRNSHNTRRNPFEGYLIQLIITMNGNFLIFQCHHIY